ncbi:MAG: type II toxin-antitoxin system RelE/ParE family toxin [Euryarchaeota archaeon]|nr:type II toxin-antitoxin system RelE/ParE family toxin [Euryarchaeota archaeon]
MRTARSRKRARVQKLFTLFVSKILKLEFFGMTYTVVVLAKAEKYLIKLEERIFDNISERLGGLEENPYRRRPLVDIKKLSGFKSPPMYRLRVGKHRIEYFVDESQKTIYITNAFLRSGDSDYR